MKKIVLGLLVTVFAVCLLLSFGNSTSFAAEKVKYGGIVKINWATQSKQIGIPLRLRGPAWWFASIALQPLIQRTEKAGVFAPCLAESWELAPDKSSYTFKLRKGVKFHDGTPLNAQAVKWNLDKVRASKRPFLSTVTSLDVIDDNTIRANLKEWHTLIPDDFRHPSCYIISPAAYEKNGEKWADTNPIGTGPFKIKDFQRSIKIVYEKNQDYWEKGKPYIDGVDVLAISDPMTQMASLLAGELHILREIQPEIVKQIQDKGNFVLEPHYAGHMVLFIDNKNSNSVWSDKRMREALEYAVNKEKITSNLGYGYFKPDYSIIMGIHDVAKPNITPRKYNPEKAKKLMAEAGHPDGLAVKLYTNIKFYDYFVDALQSDLAAVGIKMEIVRLTHAAYEEMRFSTTQGNDFRYDRPRGGVSVMLPFVKEELATTALYNPNMKRPEGWDNLLNQAMIEEDVDKQLSIMAEMETRAYNDSIAIPLWVRPSLYIFNPVLKSERKPLLNLAGQTANGWLWADFWLDK